MGKTSHCEALAERSGELGLGLRHVSVNQVVKDKQCHEGWDDEYQSWVVDEDKVSFFYFSFSFFFYVYPLSLSTLSTWSIL